MLMTTSKFYVILTHVRSGNLYTLWCLACLHDDRSLRKIQKYICRNRLSTLAKKSTFLQKEIKKETTLQRSHEVVADAKLLKEKSPKPSEQTEDGTEVIPVEPPPDLFKDLRYDEALAIRKIPTLHVWDPVVSVLVKHHLAYQPPVEVPKPFTLGLQLPVDEKKQPLELYKPFSRFTRGKVETLKVQQPWCQNATLRRQLSKQEHALQAWENSLESSARKTAWISKEIGRPAGKLLLSIPLHLPPTENHRGMSHGPEHDFPKVKHQERFYHSDAFFWMPRRVGSAEFAIDSTPTWTEKKFYKPPLTIARPHLDDMLPTSLRNERKYQDQERVREHLEKIAVKGAAVQLHWPSSVVLSPHDDYGKRKFLRRLTFLHRVPSDPVHSKACLMVEGKMYYWGEPCPQDLVEVGFVCRTGERADNEIRLANMGSTVIRCVWCKDVHSNHFNKGHYFNEHFIFDSSDRILLPLDQVTLKVQFHADYTGFWREVWHLKTKPALGPDGSSNIPISMWARALVSDDNDRRCRELEEQLDVLVANRIATNINDQLLRNLPYRDYKTILCERFPVTEDMFVVDDVELFEKANPSLSYHGHAMFTIVKVYRKVRELRRPTIAIDLVDDLEQFLLKTQPTSPHKTEESNEREKMQGSPFSNATSISADAVNVSCHIEETDARRLKLSKKGELKNDVIDVQMPSRKINGSRKTEVDELLEGNPADQDPLERRTITVKGLHKMIAGLDERMEEKGRMLMELNEAVSDMSFHRDQPNGHNFKHIVCRTALCQAADDVAGIAQRLRHDMRLNLRPESGRGFKIVTACHPTSKGEKLYGPNQKEETRHPPMSTPQTVSTVRAKHFTWTSEPISSLISEDQHRKSISDETDDITLMTSTREIERTKSVVTGSHEMYRKVLYELVYERVERLLLDLLPLMTCDQPQLDPLKPRPEL